MRRIVSFFTDRPTVRNDAESLYHRAMAESETLVSQLKEVTASNHPVCQLFADLWHHRNNTPVMTTMYETNQEMMSAVKQDHR